MVSLYAVHIRINRINGRFPQPHVGVMQSINTPAMKNGLPPDCLTRSRTTQAGEAMGLW